MIGFDLIAGDIPDPEGSARVDVARDAYLEGSPRVPGLEFVGEHEDRFATAPTDLWKDIATIEAGPAGNGKGHRVTAILRFAGYLDYVDDRRSFGVVLPSKVAWRTPGVPLEYVHALICQWLADQRESSWRTLQLRYEGDGDIGSGYEDVRVPDPEGTMFQHARARRSEPTSVRVDHVSIDTGRTSYGGVVQLVSRDIIEDGQP